MEDIALLIRDQRFEEAFQNIGTLVGQGLPTLNAHRLWAKIYANQTFEESDVIFEALIYLLKYMKRSGCFTF